MNIHLSIKEIDCPLGAKYALFATSDYDYMNFWTIKNYDEMPSDDQIKIDMGMAKRSFEVMKHFMSQEQVEIETNEVLREENHK